MKTEIIYMGTPDFSVGALLSLAAEKQFQISLVVTQPDRPKGRGRKLMPSPVKTAAQKIGFEVFQPENINSKAAAVIQSVLRRVINFLDKNLMKIRVPDSAQCITDTGFCDIIRTPGIVGSGRTGGRSGKQRHHGSPEHTENNQQHKDIKQGVAPGLGGHLILQI